MGCENGVGKTVTEAKNTSASPRMSVGQTQAQRTPYRQSSARKQDGKNGKQQRTDVDLLDNVVVLGVTFFDESEERDRGL
jgi:hypothetical protein